MCIFFQLWSFENYTSNFIPHLRHKICAPYLPLPPLIFSYFQALIHGFLWWWVCSWLIFSLKWRLQSSFFLFYFAAIDIKEAKDSNDEEDPRPTRSTWSYITSTKERPRKIALCHRRLRCRFGLGRVCVSTTCTGNRITE